MREFNGSSSRSQLHLQVHIDGDGDQDSYLCVAHSNPNLKSIQIECRGPGRAALRCSLLPALTSLRLAGKCAFWDLDETMVLDFPSLNTLHLSDCLSTPRHLLRLLHVPLLRVFHVEFTSHALEDHIFELLDWKTIHAKLKYLEELVLGSCTLQGNLAGMPSGSRLMWPTCTWKRLAFINCAFLDTIDARDDYWRKGPPLLTHLVFWKLVTPRREAIHAVLGATKRRKHSGIHLSLDEEQPMSRSELSRLQDTFGSVRIGSDKELRMSQLWHNP